jgi:peptide/nickel transport system permease protein
MAVSVDRQSGSPARWRAGRPGRSGRRLPPTLRIGAVLVGLYVLVALVGLVWTPYDPLLTTSQSPYAHPSSHYLLGTDVLGRDVLSRLMHGAREVLLLSLLSTAVSTAIGAAIGLVSGYVGGLLDTILMRAFEILISIPFLMLALLIIAAAGPGGRGTEVILFGVIVLIYAPRTARVARSVALDLVTRDFVTASRARGESTWSIVRRDLLPNASGPLLVELGVRAGYAPVLIGSLGFLGFGVHPPAPDWGLMINENRAAIATAPFSVLAPAAALAGLVIGLNLLTDGLARKIGRTVEHTA